MDRATAQPALDVVDGRAREPRVRGAQVGEELAAARRRPTRSAGTAGARDRAASRRVARGTRPRTGRRAPPSTVSSGARQLLERRARRARSAPARRPPRIRCEQLLGDELERAARAGALEEANGAVEIGRRRRRLLEERALEMRERRMRVLRRARAELLDAPVGERGEVVGGARSDANATRPGSYGQRHLNVGAARERFEQRPLGAGQVLEAVREHGLAVPRVEVALRDARPRAGAGGRGPRARAGRARRDRRRRAAPDRRRDLPGRAGPTRARRASTAACPRSRRCRAERDSRSATLRRARGGRSACAARRWRPAAAPDRRDKPSEEVVERADRAAEEAAGAREQIALDAVDVRRVRHDQIRLVVEARQIALEQKRDFARVCRPREEGEPHLPIVERPQDGSCDRSRVSALEAAGAAAAVFGRRPRRAAARPGIVPAQSSQRSATFEPRRASV